MHGPEWVHYAAVNVSSLLDVGYARRQVGNQGSRARHNIKNILCAYDIETSVIPGTSQSVCYHWQLQMGPDSPTIYGREMWETRAFLDRVASALEPDETVIIYVHNLHYEFHFLRSCFPEIKPEDVFSTAPRKPVKLTLYGGKIQMRCSYMLTNMSLGQWCRKMGVLHQKLSGDDYDYSKVRWPWTEMTDAELEYCRNDVLGLVEALSVQLETYHDTLATVGLTSTSYVRRDVKRVMKNWSYYGLRAVQPSEEVYVALRQAFRGGDTHANRYLAGTILEDVGSADRSSSYPEVCINHEFPMGTFRREREQSLTQLRRSIRLHRACLVRFRVKNLRLRDPYDPCPYVSYAKLLDDIPKSDRSLFALDNGRVLSGPYATLCMTDVDWLIFDHQYTWDAGSCEVLDLWTTRYGFLPDILRNLIISYYDDKTRLKGVTGEEVYYGKAKALLNSIYGLQAQDPCRPSVVYQPDPGPKDDLFLVEEGDIPALLARAGRQPYGSYQWGVWVTAWARWELREMILAAGDNFVYCDTDSVKYIGDLDLSSYNSAKRKLSHANGAEARDPAGETHYMGVYEDEGRSRFITWGAKKYATMDGDKLKITVAGVSKARGADELRAAAEARGLEDPLQAFRPGMMFTAAGGLEAVYNDSTSMEMEIDGHQLYVGPNVCLRPSTYKLGVTDQYADVLANAELIRRMIHNKNVCSALSRSVQNKK